MRLLFLKYYKAIMVTMVLSMMLVMPVFAISTALAEGSGTLAGQITSNLEDTTLDEQLGGGDAANLPKTIGNVIVAILGFLGIIFIILIIWAGFKWLLAQGDAGKIDKAKAMIIQSIIAIVIIFLAYAITTFVFDTIIKDGIMNQQ